MFTPDLGAAPVIQCQSIQEAMRDIYMMDRPRCIHELTHFREIPLDFDPDFLNDMSVERLRHILMAAVITSHRRSGVKRGRDD